MSVSIIIPSFNRPDRLRGCLEALSRLDGGPYETIVVDDGSPEPLAPICAEFGDTVQCLRQENAGPAKARNAGAAAATGDFLVFTDDDCRPEPGWVTALLAAQGGAEDALIGGYVVNLLEDNIYATASQTLCDFLYDYFEASEGNTPFFTSNNIGCARSGFLKLGGFDETFPLAAAEDRDFGMRWREEGGRLVYAPDAVVGHAHELSFRRFMRQHSNYGKGARHLHKVLDSREAEAVKFEGLKFYVRLLSYPWTGDRQMRLQQTFLMFLSQVAMVGGYMRSRLG
ncbi:MULTISPECIES: glycosyltransferase family 2 protein [Shimia]|uniref:glycosyltransferase family 2 protein n=1 Tax=Shimia TaxID=573139 RepID=UPI001FB33C4D|nr:MULTISPECIES: glycosyltransferase [Shimia]MDV4144316.1 glycosyltransferase [Shimia sp. FJ5]